ncbi:unnamed protein product [Moneuplotes crassus]|uniref:C2H2-type domain-containing protein n=1 Tax=Euplotes crassus TaxID=5936 RepID=A0AAD1U881_EUPCR|nr:unnamed protein product [Moneuplotes crassus]
MSGIPDYLNKNVEVIHKAFGLIGDLPSDGWAEAIQNTFSCQKLTEESKADAKEKKRDSLYCYLLDLFDNTLEQKNKYLNQNTVCPKISKNDTKEHKEVSTQKSLVLQEKPDEAKQAEDSKSPNPERQQCMDSQPTEKVCNQGKYTEPELKEPDKSLSDKVVSNTKEGKTESDSEEDEIIILDASFEEPATNPPNFSEILPQKAPKSQNQSEAPDKSACSTVTVRDLLPGEPSVERKPKSKKNPFTRLRNRREQKSNISLNIKALRKLLKTSKRSLNCPCCEKEFAFSYSLIRHIPKHWSGNKCDKPYKCPIPNCIRRNKGFIEKRGFKKHYETHSSHPLYQKDDPCKLPGLDFDLQRIIYDYLVKVIELKTKDKKKIFSKNRFTKKEFVFSRVMGKSFHEYAKTITPEQPK